MHAMVFLCSRNPDPVTTRETAQRLDASEAHMSKIFQQLVRAGFVKSTRGPGGGFVLAADPDEISLKDVFETIEGPLSGNICLLDRPICRGSECILGDIVEKINNEIRGYLTVKKISDLSHVYAKEQQNGGKEKHHKN